MPQVSLNADLDVLSKQGKIYSSDDTAASNEINRILIDRLRAGDQSANAELIQFNMPLVYKIISDRMVELSNNVADKDRFLETVNRAAMELHKYNRKFDPGRENASYSSFVRQHVLNAMRETLEQQTRSIPRKMGYRSQDNALSKLRWSYFKVHGFFPSSEYLCEHMAEKFSKNLRWTPEKVEQRTTKSKNMAALSLDYQIDGEYAWNQKIPDNQAISPDEYNVESPLMRIIDDALEVKGPDYKRVFYEFYLNEKTYGEISDELGFSDSKVRRYKQEALKIARRAVKRSAPWLGISDAQLSALSR